MLKHVKVHDILAISNSAAYAHDDARTAYYLMSYSEAAFEMHLAKALMDADEITAAADRIRYCLAMKDEAVSTNIRIGEEL